MKTRAHLAGLVLALASTAAFADAQCLACHAQKVDAEAFAASVHAPVGCSACHADVDLAKHPAVHAKPARDLCRGCHASIYGAYATSVHAQGGPICGDCHSAHAVRRASVGMHLRDTCTTCHTDALASHARWLPNTKRHLDSVACAACHAPNVEKRVDLRLHTASGSEPRAEAVSAPAKALDAKGLQEILDRANRGAAERVTLVGRLEARTPEEAHRLAPKDRALRECATCHRKGAEPFTHVTLSLVGPDGKRVRYDAASDVLHGPGTIDTMRAFYAPGGTRVQALDILLALAVGGGVLAPLGHLVMRRILRRKDRP